MEVLRERYPRTAEWINSLDPFIVIRGDTHVIVKFGDGRPSLMLTYDKIQGYESHPGDEHFRLTDH